MSDTRDLQADTAILKALGKVRAPQTRRNRELVLTIFALVVAAAALVIVHLATGGMPRPVFIGIYVALALLVVALNVVMRFVARDADPFIVPVATVLMGLGIAEIYRIDVHYLSTGDLVPGWGETSLRQVAWGLISVLMAGAVVIWLRNYRVLFRYTYVFGATGIALLLLPLVPGLGADQNADVWISIGGFFSFQPGEISKICLAIFFAGYLVRTRESLVSTGHRFLGMTWPRARELGPLLVVWAISLGIIVFQRDLGTGLLIFGMFVAMLYVATGKTSWVVLGLALAVGGAVAASRFLTYVQHRFNNWIHAFDPKVIDQDFGSYQLVGGIFGLGKGGLTGTGLGEGRPYLTPLSQSDYIIPSLGEELGLAGIFAILCLYLVFVSRGLRVGMNGQDDFGKLLATGLAFTIASQVFIMVGGVTRLIPLTGLTTPFLAAGGSSLIANWIIVGLLLRISDAVRRQPRVVIG